MCLFLPISKTKTNQTLHKTPVHSHPNIWDKNLRDTFNFAYATSFTIYKVQPVFSYNQIWFQHKIPPRAPSLSLIKTNSYVVCYCNPQWLLAVLKYIWINSTKIMFTRKQKPGPCLLESKYNRTLNWNTIHSYLGINPNIFKQIHFWVDRPRILLLIKKLRSYPQSHSIINKSKGITQETASYTYM